MTGEALPVRARLKFALWAMQLGLLVSLTTYVAWAYYLSGQQLEKAPMLLQLVLLVALQFGTMAFHRNPA